MLKAPTTEICYHRKANPEMEATNYTRNVVIVAFSVFELYSSFHNIPIFFNVSYNQLTCRFFILGLCKTPLIHGADDACEPR